MDVDITKLMEALRSLLS